MSVDRQNVRAEIEGFLASCRRPALLEPGEELLELDGSNLTLEQRASRLVLQAWDRTRNLVRRVTAIREAMPGRLELVVERFARREGRLFLVDLERPAGHGVHRRSERLVFRERFRNFLSRQFPGWTLAELSAEANLQHSLSPAHPRAFLRRGQRGLAAIAAPEDGDAGAVLTFGLIWLDYLRQRERRATVEGLALFLPAGAERTTCLRLRFLNPDAARYEVYSYSPHDFVAAVDTDDIGNLDTDLVPCHEPVPVPEWLAGALGVPGVEMVRKVDGSAGLRVRGVEFAQVGAESVRFGLGERIRARAQHAGEIERIARELARVRNGGASDREHPLWRQSPEAWLESQVRGGIEAVDASLLPAPVYSQVLAFAGGERGVIDLLAVERSGRLAILELKATADLHLPLQALDYWMRLRWHLGRGEFASRGYFPGIALRDDPPRILLVSPALEFHPTTEAVLSYFSPAVPVERAGVGVEWRKGITVMFRLQGAQRPQ